MISTLTYIVKVMAQSLKDFSPRSLYIKKLLTK